MVVQLSSTMSLGLDVGLEGLKTKMSLPGFQYKFGKEEFESELLSEFS